MSRRVSFVSSRLRLSSWTRLCLVFLFGLTLYLGVRAHEENRWSDWGFGDAQTMLSLKQWQEGGWVKNHLLFKPQGYAPVVDLLDQPELRHHAHGTSSETSPRVGPRLLYTHYPAGYLIPYAALFKIGTDGIFAMRMLSILFSVVALGLMYLLFAVLVSPRVSLVAVLFYALSSSFLGFADSLANQPLDDLLRFGFMVAVVFSTRADSATSRGRWSIIAWVVQLLLSLSSFDSVFFLYTWLVGWDLLEKRGFRWQRYLLYALAPLLAHSLQFFQNAWYLGIGDAWRDIVDTFTLKHGSRDDGGGGRVRMVMMALVAVCYMAYSPGIMLVLVFGLYAMGCRWLSGSSQPLPPQKLLLLLLVCGAGFELALPRAALISSYEGRQMIPFAALLAGGYTWLVLDGVRAELATIGARSGFRVRELGFLGIAGATLVAFWGLYCVSNRFEKELPLAADDIELAESLKAMPTPYGPVYFDAGGFESYLDSDFVRGYPQIRPETEYYAGSRLILCFANPQLLVQDLAVMVRKADRRFSPVVLTDRPETMDLVLKSLLAERVISALPDSALRVIANGRQIQDLTAVVKWKTVREFDAQSEKL